MALFLKNLKRFLVSSIYQLFPDRIFLQNYIFKQVNLSNFEKILFVGCKSYTQHYSTYFQGDQDFWTIDIDPKNLIYGSKKHITGDATHLDRYFSNEYFDVIFLNGVFGYGINNIDDIINTLISAKKVLQNEGILILGYNPNRIKELSFFKKKLEELFFYKILNGISEKVFYKNIKKEHRYLFLTISKTT